MRDLSPRWCRANAWLRLIFPVPVRLNRFAGWNPAAYEQALRDEFDQLYEEGAHRRRMMVVSLHDRISGHAGRIRALDRFLTYARSKGDVWFARKDEIARYVLAKRASTPVINRGSPSVTGLPGSTI